MRERTRSLIESFVIAAIILVLIQTFLEDLAVLVKWTWPARRILVFTGFFFDLFFSIEFLIRLYTAVFNGRAGEYLRKDRGWIDFLASIPLLLLSSGPAVLSVISGGTVLFAMGSMLNVLKVIKAIRIARILRLLRVLKIFKQIKYTDSTMAQRHVSKITSLTVSLFVLTLFVATLVSSFIGIPSVDEIATGKNQQSVERLAAYIQSDNIEPASITKFAEMESDLLVLKIEGKTVFSRYDNNYYQMHYGPGDYQYLTANHLECYFDISGMLNVQARNNIIYFLIMISLVVLLLVYYSPHFAITVTDPLQVMQKGITDPLYNFEVKIPDRYQNDDIYRLADAYNRIFLPLKDRNQENTEAQSSVLNLDDVKDLLSEE